MAEMEIKVIKGRGSLKVDLEKIPPEVVAEIWAQGLITILNRGMSKIVGQDTEKNPNPEKREKAMEIANKNLEKLYAGEVRKTSGVKQAKAGGEIMTEARRLAKLEVKAALKEQGVKVSYVASSEITRLSNELLNSDEGKPLIEIATKTVEARKTDKPTIKVNVTSVQVDEKLKAKAEKQKEERRAATAAKRAAQGKPPVTPRKGKGATQATA